MRGVYVEGSALGAVSEIGLSGHHCGAAALKSASLSAVHVRLVLLFDVVCMARCVHDLMRVVRVGS